MRVGCGDRVGGEGRPLKLTLKPRLWGERPLQIWGECRGQREQQARGPRSTEPLTHPRNPQEEGQCDGLGEGGVTGRSLDLILGAQGTPAEDFKQGCNNQFVLLKSIPFSFVWELHGGGDSGEDRELRAEVGEESISTSTCGSGRGGRGGLRTDRFGVSRVYFDGITDGAFVGGLTGCGERMVSSLSNWPEGGFSAKKVSLGKRLVLGGGHRIRGHSS